MPKIDDADIPVPALLTEALSVTVVDDEIFIGGPPYPTLTPEAARNTAKRLIAAADEAEHGRLLN